MHFSLLCCATTAFFCIARYAEAATILEFCTNQGALVEDHFADFRTKCSCENQHDNGTVALLSCMDGCQNCVNERCYYADIQATIEPSADDDGSFVISETCHVIRDTPQKMCSQPKPENAGNIIDVLENETGHMPEDLSVKCPDDDDSTSGGRFSLPSVVVLGTIISGIGVNIV